MNKGWRLVLVCFFFTIENLVIEIFTNKLLWITQNSGKRLCRAGRYSTELITTLNLLKNGHKNVFKLNSMEKLMQALFCSNKPKYYCIDQLNSRSLVQYFIYLLIVTKIFFSNPYLYYLFSGYSMTEFIICFNKDSKSQYITCVTHKLRWDFLNIYLKIEGPLEIIA